MMPRPSRSPIAPMTPPARRCTLPLAIIEVRHVEVEVPSSCPRCGADFESEADCNLIEVNYAEEAFLGRVADVGGLTHFDVDTGGEVRPSAEWYPVRYECVRCRHVISAATARVVDAVRGVR